MKLLVNSTRTRDSIRQAYRDARAGLCSLKDLHASIVWLAETGMKVALDIPPDPPGWSLRFWSTHSSFHGGLIRFRDGSWSIHS